MGLLIQTIVFGLLLGSLYALASTGLALTFGVMKIVNLVHGPLLILGGYFAYTLWSGAGIDPLAGLVLSAAGVGVVAWVLYQLLIRPALPGGEGGTMIATFALLVAAEGVFALVWGHDPLSLDPPYARTSLVLGDIVVPHTLLFGTLITAVLLGALFVLLRRTWFGRALRAASGAWAGRCSARCCSACSRRSSRPTSR